MVCVNDTLATLSDNTGALGVHIEMDRVRVDVAWRPCPSDADRGCVFLRGVSFPVVSVMR